MERWTKTFHKIIQSNRVEMHNKAWGMGYIARYFAGIVNFHLRSTDVGITNV